MVVGFAVGKQQQRHSGGRHFYDTIFVWVDCAKSIRKTLYRDWKLTMFYSPSHAGFYSVAIHGDEIPADAVEISAAEHASLLDGQSQGKRIVADAQGRPVLFDSLPPPPVPPKQFTSLEFLDLFTPEEQLTIATAAMQSAPVKLWYDRTLAAMFITLADPRTEAGLNALVKAGLLTAERKAAIAEAMG